LETNNGKGRQIEDSSIAIYKGVISLIKLLSISEVRKMVSEGRGRLFRRKDGKYLIYLPKDFAEDSMFPFKGSDSIFVKVSFAGADAKRLLIEEWKEVRTNA